MTLSNPFTIDHSPPYQVKPPRKTGSNEPEQPIHNSPLTIHLPTKYNRQKKQLATNFSNPLSTFHFPLSILLHLHPYPFTMAGKFGCIHTLNSCDAIAEIAFMCYKNRVFKNIGSLGQPAKEEISAGVFSGFVIA
jgi:hypothetical protein